MGLESQGPNNWVSSTQGGWLSILVVLLIWPIIIFDSLLTYSGCSADLTNHYIRPVAYIFIIQGFKDADGAAGGDLGGTYGNEFLERSLANESHGNGENFCMHSANLTSSSQVGKSFDFLEANQDMSQTTRLNDEDGTGSFSPILVCSKSLRPSIEVLTSLEIADRI